MNIKNDLNFIMENVCINEEMKNEIFNATTRKKYTKGGMSMKKKIIIGALVAVMCIGTVTVGAKGISKLWDATFTKKFSINDDNMEKLVDKGDVQIVDEEVVTGKDIELSVKLTYVIVDDNAIRCYVETKSQDVDNMADDFNGFGDFEIEIDGKRVSCSTENVYSALDGDKGAITQGQEIIRTVDENSEYDCGVLITLQTENRNIVGKEMKLKLKDAVFRDVKVDGKWEFTHAINEGSKPKQYKLDSQWTRKESEFNRESVTYNLKKITINPFSYTIDYEVVGEVRFDGVWTVEGTGFDCVPITIVLKDGTVYSGDTEEGQYTLGESTLTYTNTTEIRSLYKPVDVQQIDYMIVNGQKVK